ncbi:hypothetical protein ACJX0J_012353, partial [Zea mays]
VIRDQQFHIIAAMILRDFFHFNNIATKRKRFFHFNNIADLYFIIHYMTEIQDSQSITGISIRVSTLVQNNIHIQHITRGKLYVFFREAHVYKKNQRCNTESEKRKSLCIKNKKQIYGLHALPISQSPPGQLQILLNQCPDELAFNHVSSKRKRKNRIWKRKFLLP